MRLHSLSVTAFGPFAQTVEVDFDTLSEAGLFLLSGATGAGKTSVLDAICFALYGEVPGDRNTAKRLRADQAAADVRPTVVLEASMGERRLKLTRSPAWERAKKRGHGMTSEQASVVVQESVGETWVTRTTRADEAGHFVTGLLGLTLSQFCQVALLPQGRFQSFLRARSEERHQLLQQLFRTQRFSDVESWLADHRRQQRRDSSALQEDIRAVVNRICEATRIDQLPAIDPSPAGIDELDLWAKALLSQAQKNRTETDTLRGVLLAEAALAAEAHNSAVELAQLQATHDQAERAATQLADDSQSYEQALGSLERDVRATSLAPLLSLVQQSAQSLQVANARLIESAASAGRATSAALDPHFPASIDADISRCVDQLAALNSLRPVAAERSQLLSQQQDAELELAAISRSIAASVRLDEAAETDLARLQAQLADSQTALKQTEELRLRQKVNAALTQAHADLAELARALDGATIDVSSVRARALSLKERWLEIRESRLNGMAAEIAISLVVGGSCPVCGSAEHPRVAQAVHHAPDATSEREARSALEDAEAELIAFQDRHRELIIKSAVLREQVGESTAEECRKLDAQLAQEMQATFAAATRLDEIQEAVHNAAAKRFETYDLLQRARTRSAHLEANLSQLAPVIARLQAELDSALHHHRGAAIEDVVETLTRQLAALRQAATAAREWSSVNETNRQHVASLEQSAVALGFSDPETVRTHLLSPDVRTRTQECVTDYETRLREAQRVLETAPYQEAARAERADPTSTERRLDSATTAAAKVEADLVACQTRLARLADLQRILGASLSGWRPVLADLELAVQVASLAEGSSSDNASQMRLSAYVLAYRLGQVVAAANERLVAMSDQRYRLEHSGRRGAGERRGGLSLLVRDDWSGETRDPATLSGGETFVVSLALALGLADVIAHEVGGADLDTLFVDEGFGALDSDTLDDVMDTLDSLRAGGRVVGVVSHVAEMRHRIPTRLHVTKRRTGSTISLVHGK